MNGGSVLLAMVTTDDFGSHAISSSISTVSEVLTDGLQDTRQSEVAGFRISALSNDPVKYRREHAGKTHPARILEAILCTHCIVAPAFVEIGCACCSPLLKSSKFKIQIQTSNTVHHSMVPPDYIATTPLHLIDV